MFSFGLSYTCVRFLKPVFLPLG